VVDIALLDEVSGERESAVRRLCRSPATAAAAVTLALQLGHTPGKLRALERIRDWSR
jgi:hypothetical protein